MSSLSDYAQKLETLNAEEAKMKEEFARRRKALEEEVAALRETRVVYTVQYKAHDHRHVSFCKGLYTTRELAERHRHPLFRSDGCTWTGNVIAETRTLTLNDLMRLDKWSSPDSSY
jgi:hypothetical protein